MDAIDKDVVEESTVRHTSFTDRKTTLLTFLVRLFDRQEGSLISASEENDDQSTVNIFCLFNTY